MKKWWLNNEDEDKDEDKFANVKDFKARSQKTSDIIELAKEQHMNTDIKKAIF
jgi:nucleolar MIF4G domain-containing protein 1